MVSRRRKTPTQEVFGSEDYGVSKIRHYNGFIAQLYRSILGKLKVSRQGFNRHLTNYYREMGKLGLTKPADRGNVSKALLAPEVTWKTFCKGLPILGIEEIEINVSFKTKDGKVHHIEGAKINLSVEHDYFTEDDRDEFMDMESKFKMIPKKKAKEEK